MLDSYLLLPQKPIFVSLDEVHRKLLIYSVWPNKKSAVINESISATESTTINRGIICHEKTFRSATTIGSQVFDSHRHDTYII